MEIPALAWRSRIRAFSSARPLPEMPELTVEELSRQTGPAALLEALRVLGGAASPGELRLRTRMAPSTVSKWLAELRSAGLVEGPKPKPRLTEQGWACAEQPPLAGRQELAAAIDRWPAEPQRAFLRLLVAGVAARWHLGSQRRQRHPGFVIYGPPGTGKTAAAQFACRALGLDVETHVISLPGRHPDELIGRREVDPMTGQWGYRPSPMLGRALVAFEGIEQATDAQCRAVSSYFQGQTRLVIEETTVHARAVPLLVCDAAPRISLVLARGSIMLDVGTFATQLSEVDLVLRDLEAAGLPPRLDLNALQPAIGRLPHDAHLLLRDTLHRGLTADGRALCRVDAVELLALGYTAGIPAPVDPTLPVLSAALDYLTCTETLGHTRPGWLEPLSVSINRAAGATG
jgi:DNA-binding transcriptional ArsR family regulator